MTPEKIRDICAALAKITGNRYEMTEPDPRARITEYNPITDAILCQVSLGVGYDKKLSVWTSYPLSVANAKQQIGYFVLPSTTIHANPDRPAPALAADIARRLLPAARADWEKMRENYHKEAARTEQVQGDLAAILAVSPAIRQSKGSGNGRAEFGYHAQGINLGGEVTTYGVTLNNLRLPAALAVKVMELVTTPQNWNQLQESINR